MANIAGETSIHTILREFRVSIKLTYCKLSPLTTTGIHF